MGAGRGDRRGPALAVSRSDRATAVGSRYPMLGVLIAYTVVGLFLLLGA